ncbi:uncharacterized protein BDV14DRAFT_65264 [Aspergillus stella-maris]|uniref:uncharacterized protein n=1 Tax=Aspergillus stella-maris TaxID=1810926 RepID=UPI003CCCE372
MLRRPTCQVRPSAPIQIEQGPSQIGVSSMKQGEIMEGSRKAFSARTHPRPIFQTSLYVSGVTNTIIRHAHRIDYHALTYHARWVLGIHHFDMDHALRRRRCPFQPTYFLYSLPAYVTLLCVQNIYKCQ